MTALHAVGGGLPLALHMPNVVEQAGSLAGFAAVIGLAVLSALYFSQARDLRRLREWAGRAPERAAETGTGAQQAPVPGRVVATPQRPQAGVPGAAVVPPKPAGAPGQPSAPTAAPGQPSPAATSGAANGDAAPAVSGDKPAGGDAKPADAKPGMPAPASAAAAASAGAAAAASAGASPASAVGPKAPEAKPAGDGQPQGGPPAAQNAPEATQSGSAAGTAGPAAGAAAGAAAGSAARPSPQRPPGSVLPPRTGTLPPVRRLPSSNVGGSQQTSILGPSAQQQQPRKRNPLYVVLAVIGVLVLGTAAAIGVPAIVNGSKSSSKKPAAATHKRTHAHRAPVPADITVAVLNGTSINGLAGQIGDRVEADGFNKGTVSNASLTNGQRANSVVMYVPGHQADAKLVAKRLSVSNVEPADSASRQIAGDATVIVVVGTDKSQGAG